MQAVSAQGLVEGAPVLVASGAALDPTRQLAAALRREGVACGVVGVALMQPFPVDALARTLGTAEVIVTIEAGEDAAQRSPLNAGVMATVASCVEVAAQVPPACRVRAETSPSDRSSSITAS